jgi:hypothetical protein
MAAYTVRLLECDEAAAGARAWNDLADGTLPPDAVRRIEGRLSASGTGDFAAFVAESDGGLCGIATARLAADPIGGTFGEIEALMIDGRLPDEAGDALARLAVDWLGGRGASSVRHLRDAAAPGAFWERLGFRPELLGYTLRL